MESFSYFSYIIHFLLGCSIINIGRRKKKHYLLYRASNCIELNFPDYKSNAHTESYSCNARAEDVVGVGRPNGDVPSSSGSSAQNSVRDRCRLPVDRSPGVGADAIGSVARRRRRRSYDTFAQQRRERIRRYEGHKTRRSENLLLPLFYYNNIIINDDNMVYFSFLITHIVS